MKNMALQSFKIALVLLLLFYVINFDISPFTLKMDAILTLGASVLLLVKSRGNLIVSLSVLFILYCNYSIIMAEYLGDGSNGIPVYQVKTAEIYGQLIRIMLLFTSILLLFYKGAKVSLSQLKVKPRDNVLVFYGLIFFLFMILIFGVNRSELTSYAVSITPWYEYSTILFLIAYFFSGESKIRKVLFVILLTFFVLQDFYYGGRITSLQLILLFFVTMYAKHLKFKLILIFATIGIFINTLVGVYRSTYSWESIHIGNILSDLVSDKFIFATPVYAYYASATHVAATSVATLEMRITSFLTFVSSILTGSNNEIGNVTLYVNNQFFQNIGGGVLPSHFYFWFGWPGVIIIALIIVFLLNKVGHFKNDFLKLCALMIILTVPRWYLYTPLILFRPLVFLAIGYVLVSLVHKFLIIIYRNKGQQKSNTTFRDALGKNFPVVKINN